jgi:hypothetical protein
MSGQTGHASLRSQRRYLKHPLSWQTKGKNMELIAIQVSATVALLLGHIIAVMRSLWSNARTSPLYGSTTSWFVKCEQLRRNRNSVCTTLPNHRGIERQREIHAAGDRRRHFHVR